MTVAVTELNPTAPQTESLRIDSETREEPVGGGNHERKWFQRE